MSRGITVGDLKKILEGVSDDTPVLVYSEEDEGADFAYGARLAKNTLNEKSSCEEGYADGLSYVKGDWPFVKKSENIFIIGENPQYLPNEDDNEDET